ncbi:MAG: O-antigen ligase domain-containing protein [Alphaproteobacteria bacterium]|nr:MAG: O-antigen ligase domain-containing protein [Alphaproteobacteria bacterium]
MIRWLVLLVVPLSLVSPGITLVLPLLAFPGLFLWFRRRGLPSRLAPAGRWALGLYLLLLLLDMLNGNPPGLVVTVVNYLPLIAAVPVALALSEARLSPRALDAAMQATIALAALAALVETGLLGFDRARGLNLNPNPFALVVATWAVWQLARGLETAAPRPLAAALLGVVPVVLSGSKNGLLALVMGSAVVLGGHAFRGRWRIALPAMIAAGALVAALMIAQAERLSLSALPESVEQYLTGTAPGEDSLGARLRIWRPALEAVSEAPLLGHGRAEAKAAVRRHIPPEDGFARGLAHVHNDYLAHLVAFGVGGLVFILGFLLAVVQAGRRSPLPGMRIFGTAFAAMLASYMGFDVVFNLDPTMGLWSLALAMMLTDFKT